MNNFYLYRFAGKRLSLLIPWDQDNSFSRMDMPPWEGMSKNVLASKIWDEPKYRNTYLKALLDVADIATAGGGSSRKPHASTERSARPRMPTR